MYHRNTFQTVLITIIIALFGIICVQAQTEMVDVLYLKNGSIINGKITEMVPNQTIKIKTADGSLFVFKMEEVEKVSTEEKVAQKPTAIDSKVDLLNINTVEGASPAKPAVPDAQSNKTSLNRDTVYWIHQYAYEQLVHKKIFTEGMSDDEMAGILLYKGGKNLMGAFACEIFGALTGSLIFTFRPTQQEPRLVLAVLSTGFFITGVVSLISGYYKISRAGIILQHKKFNVRTSGTSLSLNF